jgi:hypothetical protein
VDDEPRHPDLTIPDVIEPIVAYRAWVVDANHTPALYSHHGHVWWEADGLEAVHSISTYVVGEHIAPAKGCKCGIYAHKTVAQVLSTQIRGYSWKLLRKPKFTTLGIPIVRYHPMGGYHIVEPGTTDEMECEWNLIPLILIGRVLLGGKFIPYTRGYRAQYAKIDELYYIPPTAQNSNILDAAMDPRGVDDEQVILSGFKVLNDIGNYYGVRVNPIDHILKEQGIDPFRPDR